MPIYSVYILICQDKSYYVGLSTKIKKRIQEHQSGQCHYTKSRLPVKLAFLQTFNTKEKAGLIERKIKRWSRKKKEKLISNEWEILV